MPKPIPLPQRTVIQHMAISCTHVPGEVIATQLINEALKEYAAHLNVDTEDPLPEEHTFTADNGVTIEVEVQVRA